MSQVSVKCPKCGNLCTFRDGKVFGYCNKCGSSIERDVVNNVKAYDRSSETDKSIKMTYDRANACAMLKIPTRERFDIEGFNFEVERIMDNLIVFNEIMTDIYDSLPSMDFDRRKRVCEVCCDLIDRVCKQYEDFITEYEDYGVKEILSETSKRYTELENQLSSEFSKVQSKALKELWKGREGEYAELQKKLEEAKMHKKSIPLFNLNANWEADNEISDIERKLNGIE